MVSGEFLFILMQRDTYIILTFFPVPQVSFQTTERVNCTFKSTNARGRMSLSLR